MEMKMQMKLKQNTLNEEKTEKENLGLYVAIDSDILRFLSYLEHLKTQHGFVDRSQVNAENLLKDFNYYLRLFNHVQAGHIKLLIVDAVYQESKHAANLLNFMNKYCYFPDVNSKDYQKKVEKARVLAHAYCQPYTINGKEYKAPMKFVYMAYANKHVPTNDAYIMAQATVEDCCLLTGNKQDFIFNKRDGIGNRSRLIGICHINEMFGYCETRAGGVFMPKPLTLSKIMGLLRGKEEFGIVNQSQDKIQGGMTL